MRKFLAKSIVIKSLTILIMFIVTIFTCQISYDDAVTYLWQRNYSVIDIPDNCTIFCIPFSADSSNVHIKGYMINAYGKLYIVNKTSSK
jgi:hypothetical protein